MSSSPELAAPVVTEATAAPAAAVESTPTAEAVVTSAPVEQASDAPVAAATTVAEADAAAPAAAEEVKAVEAGKTEEKKDKKQGRKPFADLLNKILKPHPHEKSTPEKKVEAEVAPAVEEAAAEVAAPVVEAPAVEPEVAAEAPEAAAAAVEAPAEAVPAEDATKEITTPRKERGNIFEKFTAFVMKPKSPKGKKAEAPKEDTEEVKTEATPAEVIVTEAPPAEEVAPSSPQIAAPKLRRYPLLRPSRMSKLLKK